MKSKIILGAIIIIIVAAGILAFNASRPYKGNSGGACTEEALMCPDGSAVGRSGEMCEFVACPNQESYVGILNQVNGEFRLLIENTQNPSENYILPLELRVSNVTGQLVNQKVRVFGKFEKANILKVETIEEVSANEDENSEDVKVGQTKEINGLDITLNEMVGDYRCPIDEKCMEGGAVTVNVTFKRDGSDEVTRNIASDEIPFEYEGYKISIVGVKPSRLASQEPPADSYIVTFKVEER